MSFTITVPAGVPSERHNSRPFAGVDAVKNQRPRHRVRPLAAVLPGPTPQPRGSLEYGIVVVLMSRSNLHWN